MFIIKYIAYIYSKHPKCEVCEEFFADLTNGISKDNSESDTKDWIRNFCNNTNVKNYQKICYNIGGVINAPTGSLNTISTYISSNIPPHSICEKIYKYDQQICDFKKEVPFDFKNLNKNNIRALKNQLDKWNAKCEGCIEKSDFITKVQELMKIHKSDEL